MECTICDDIFIFKWAFVQVTPLEKWRPFVCAPERTHHWGISTIDATTPSPPSFAERICKKKTHKNLHTSSPHRPIVPSCRVAATLRSSAASASLAPFVELHVPRGARSSFVGRAQHAASILTPTDIHSFLIRIRIIQIRARSLTANQSPVSPHTYIHHQPRIAVYLFGKYIYEYVHIYMLKSRPPSWILCLVIKGFAQCARRYPHIIKSQHLHNLDKSLPLSCIYMPAYRRAERLLCARYTILTTSPHMCQQPFF